MSDMYNNKYRTPLYKKDSKLESALYDLNELISEIQPKNVIKIPETPIVLIMGCPRSGSTLFLQWLASLGIFSYPSNLIARFYKNPYIGIRVQQSLLEFDPLNQIGFNKADLDFSSSLGKTMGALNPSEFWYFWREYFKFGDINILSEKELNKVDYTFFLSKLAAFRLLTGMPLVMKGMLLNWHIPYLYKIFNKFIFIDIRRDEFFNAQSLLISREKYFNSREKWYSFKPEEYEILKDSSPIEQVAGQVVYTRKAIELGLSSIPDDNKLQISYEDFCKNPKSILDKIYEKFNKLNYSIEIKEVADNKIQPYSSSCKIILNAEEQKLLINKLAEFSQ